jgi:hypothetical protein
VLKLEISSSYTAATLDGVVLANSSSATTTVKHTASVEGVTSGKGVDAVRGGDGFYIMMSLSAYVFANVDNFALN